MNVNDFDQTLKDVLRYEVSRERFRLEKLEERIVTEISGTLPNPGLWGTFKQLMAPTREARFGQLAALGATAVIFLVLGAFLALQLPSLQPASQQALLTHPNEVLFVMPAPNAQSVTIVGNFTGWEATPLADVDKDGIWTVSLPLSPGRYEYAFVVDGRWWGHDPLADEYVRSFGETNAVRYVGLGDGA
jgi:hypothetical protein